MRNLTNNLFKVLFIFALAFGSSTGTPTSSKVTGHASNLTGQLKQLEFKEITEGNAIYYLAETKISDGEFLKFDVKILPQGEKKPARLKFDKRFFTY